MESTCHFPTLRFPTSRPLCALALTAFRLFLPVLLLSACAGTSITPISIATLAPLQLEGREVTVNDVSRQIKTPDLLSLDDGMRAFVHRYATGPRRSRRGSPTGSRGCWSLV